MNSFIRANCPLSLCALVVGLASWLPARSDAALTITLHPDGLGGTVVAVAGSGVTGADNLSQLTNNLTFGEQWLNMSGNPFSDTLNPDNSVHMFNTPIPITSTVSITGIEVDNDGTGDLQDDFRIFVSGLMYANEPYSASGITTLSTHLSYDVLNVGSYTDDEDGGTTFLNGFTLVISDQVVPEPTSALLLGASALLGMARRRRG
ncbi:hypothetical protein HNR46_003318 [Haloferula luteola]|uniref:Ice-binding protein C-terminal domain-containing protein n=1 Tax=Haloferula luteola TaxID=595692 RepID=A0A840V4W8_9BACT|nr:PEP-CTERM sorting domain-containing protein [Haloferula luteola]MBB5353065.1 hypothetical protein [Haloferula luteola]